MSDVLASDIARTLGTELKGPDLSIATVSSLAHPRAHSLSYRISDWNADALPRPMLVVAASPPSGNEHGLSVIIDPHPRQAYAYIVDRFLTPALKGIAPSALIGSSVVLGPGVCVGEGVIIEEDVQIGDDTYIEAGALIGRGSRIGARCRIGARTVIGNEGLGSFETSDGQLRNVRHLGQVRIGDDVEIGALCAVARGTIDDTVIGHNTHIGPMVNIGHNSAIGARCQIAGRSHLSGSVVIEDEARLWANCVLKDGVRIGTRATVGMGALVNHDVLPGQTVATLPAIGLRKLAQFIHNVKWGR